MTSSIAERTKPDTPDCAGAEAARPRKLTPAAERALAEAAARRRSVDDAAAALPKERHGRGGAEPVRYGDWEVKGIASDF